jgi:hypothetical protein
MSPLKFVLLPRPLRTLWQLIITAVAVIHFGWMVLIPLAAITFDTSFKTKKRA